MEDNKYYIPGRNGLTVFQLAQELDLSVNSVKKSLNSLIKKGLVKEEKPTVDIGINIKEIFNENR